MASRTPGKASVADGVRTTVIFLIAIGAVVAFFALNRPSAQLPDAVEYQGVVEYARAEYPYEVLAPADVPEEWRATSVDHAQDVRGNRWRVGFLRSDQDFVGVEQTDGEVESYLRDRLRDFREDGVSRIDGDSWQRWVEQDRTPDRALVLNRDGVVTIVRGTTEYGVLEEFVRRLE